MPKEQNFGELIKKVLKLFKWALILEERQQRYQILCSGSDLKKKHE